MQCILMLCSVLRARTNQHVQHTYIQHSTKKKKNKKKYCTIYIIGGAKTRLTNVEVIKKSKIVRMSLSI